MQKQRGMRHGTSATNAWLPFVPQRAPTEEEGSLRQRKSMTYRQLPPCGDVGSSSSLLCFSGLTITQGERPRVENRRFIARDRVRIRLCGHDCGTNYRGHSYDSYSTNFLSVQTVENNFLASLKNTYFIIQLYLT